jgi:metal-responsive CopG/Arc/MetJ family transcriptional regulator
MRKAAAPQQKSLIGAYIAEEERLRLDRWRKRRGWSRSFVIREALRHYIQDKPEDARHDSR